MVFQVYSRSHATYIYWRTTSSIKMISKELKLSGILLDFCSTVNYYLNIFLQSLKTGDGGYIFFTIHIFNSSERHNLLLVLSLSFTILGFFMLHTEDIDLLFTSVINW